MPVSGPGAKISRLSGAERLHLVQPLAQRQVGAEAAAAEEGARHLGRQLFEAAGPAGEVEAQAAERPQG